MEKDTADLFEIQKVYGVRMFFGLQRNEWKSEPAWMQNMFRLECAVEEMPQFRDVAFFHPVILKKGKSPVVANVLAVQSGFSYTPVFDIVAAGDTVILVLIAVFVFTVLALKKIRRPAPITAYSLIKE